MFLCAYVCVWIEWEANGKESNCFRLNIRSFFLSALNVFLCLLFVLDWIPIISPPHSPPQNLQGVLSGFTLCMAGRSIIQFFFFPYLLLYVIFVPTLSPPILPHTRISSVFLWTEQFS